MNHFKLACGASAIFALASVFALGRSDHPMVVAPVVNAGEEELARARKELAAAMGSFEDVPKVVTTETIKLNEVVLTPPPESKSPPKVAEKKEERNVCTRHGMQKVKTGRYGWRCKKRK